METQATRAQIDAMRYFGTRPGTAGHYWFSPGMVSAPTPEWLRNMEPPVFTDRQWEWTLYHIHGHTVLTAPGSIHDKRRGSQTTFTSPGVLTGMEMSLRCTKAFAPIWQALPDRPVWTRTQSPWIQTFSGRRFDPLNPDPRQVSIVDIARSLAFQCRFNGHTKEFYSVAQHCVLASQHVDQADTNAVRWALMHDAPEAYIQDLPRPLKHHPAFAFYREVEHRVMGAVCTAFGLPLEEPPAVGEVDRKLVVTEAEALMSPLHPDWELRRPTYEGLDIEIVPVGPQEAERMFLDRYAEVFA